MTLDPTLLLDRIGPVVGWSVLTIGFYLLTKRLYRIWPHWWMMPLLLSPVLVIIVVLAMKASYSQYIHGAGWLMLLLGPATVAFAVPIYEQRVMIRENWPILLIGMIAGTTTAICVSYGLATVLGLSDSLRLSLVPRSISTPFAMEVSSEIGGIPELTALFVVITGVLGAAVGDALLSVVPVKTALARGALFGVAAHGAGTAKANQIGRVEGSISGLIMVLVGLLNVMIAPVLHLFLH